MRTSFNLREAAALQKALAQRVVLWGGLQGVRYLAALDASHPPRFSGRGPSVAAAVLWDLEAARVVEVATVQVQGAALFPYVPGFLSFREAPLYLAALARLSRFPQALLVDGQGVAHPRGLGIAAHLGVQLDLPAIGVAKGLLCGHPEGELPMEAGASVRLMMGGVQVGWVYRSRKGVRPLYISPGHRVGMEEALAFVRALPGKTRLPEPLRRAHLEAGAARRRLEPV
ncbi:MAG: endonuclease V [Meiothermus sp.]|uniref:endonuclease V n=1 Tax=Meiothermus sp. TaxID=1955249 RepID=UPI0025DDFFF2|nr:endonuclease V [Meiothermus sp.]MCS7057807.1 endonuclease V [Meiothermus sp.]MCS7194650.1 endonuclease V [Meiothermus sp.]MCX7740839.1 endonuclease V [Meiothermus sp.]MDW8090941.1 endonuclease V [Meiothermus sp.]MDW8481835.1 endonuclease V [Meiothermus sp.]